MEFDQGNSDNSSFNDLLREIGDGPSFLVQPMFQDNPFDQAQQTTSTLSQNSQMNTFPQHSFKIEDDPNQIMQSLNTDMSVSNSDYTTSPPSPQTASFNFTTDLTDFSPSYEYASSPPSFIPLNGEASTPGLGGIRILVQPKSYQIVNYNIYPAPEIEFSTAYADPVTVQAFLIYKEETTIDITEGFTNGDVQVLKVGQTRVSFPALHLNRMTPIKNAVQQSGNNLGPNFAVLFKIGEFTLLSNNFKLVSACNQIPQGVDVRPRKQKDKPSSTVSTPSSTTSHSPFVADVIPMSSVKPISKTVSSSGKRRATDDLVFAEEEIFLHVKVRGDVNHRGFITVYPSSSLKEARDEISKSNNYPKGFRFWFAKMSTIVQPHQEESIKATDAVDGTCLILEPYDSTLQHIDSEILSLWLAKKDVKDPLIPLVDLIRTLFSVYKANTTDLNELNIINGGISHFLVNITKSREQPGLIGLEDFKLFLKFFGPSHDCLNRVLSVYREPFFHGFARHGDAVELLKGKPGYFLIRYSESQLKDGYIAFNVNKGNSYRDVIENYSMRYIAEQGCFVFRDKQYRTIREFVTDPEYAPILRHGLEKTTVETIKESKYKNATELSRV